MSSQPGPELRSPPPLIPYIYLLDASRDVSGALRAAQREAACLRGDARFVLAIPASSKLSAHEFEPFAKVVRLPIVNLRRSLGSTLLYLPALVYAGWKLARAMRADGCERLQVNDYYLMQGAVARLFGYRGKIVTWVRIDPHQYGGPIAKLWLRVANAVSSQMVAVSRFIAGLLDDSFRAELVYDPVTDASGSIVEPEVRFPPRFVFVANYIPGKGQDIAIRAFGYIANAFPSAHLHFHGSDLGLAKNRAYLEELTHLALQSPGAGRIHLGDFTDDVGGVLDGALAALCLSRSESFSLTCQEASVRGVAVIATRCGGPEEIVEDGVTGYLVTLDDPGAVADRMTRLLADPSAARTMGKRGVALVRARFGTPPFRATLARLFDLPLYPADADRPSTTEPNSADSRGNWDESE